MVMCNGIDKQTHVVFVDDEPHILGGLRRTMRRNRPDWKIHFATSGAEALDLMGQYRTDVVVSDMRMPRMDGAELLGHISNRHPGTLRYVLSGHCETDMVIRAIGPCHHYFAKPCDASDIEEWVSAGIGYRQDLPDTRFMESVFKLQHLPSLPENRHYLLGLLKGEHVEFGQIARILMRDPALAAKTLQLAGSDLFNARWAGTSPIAASKRLGIDMMRQFAANEILCDAGIEAAEESQQRAGEAALRRIALRSWKVSEVARQIAQLEGLTEKQQMECASAGLLHDIGTALMASYAPLDFEDMCRLSMEENSTIEEAGCDIFGAGSAWLGGSLLGIWGISNSIVNAIRMLPRVHELSYMGLSPAMVLHIANALVPRHEEALPEKELDHELMRDMGFEQKLADWRVLSRVLQARCEAGLQ